MPDDNEFETQMDAVLKEATDRLGSFDEETEDYNRVLDRVERLSKIKTSMQPETSDEDEGCKNPDRTRFKDFLPMIGSLGGILIIVSFEAFGHILSSKATSFVSKPR